MKNLGFLGYPNYAVTKEGTVFSFLSKRFLKNSTCKTISGIHVRVNLYNDEGSKTIEVHRLVAQAFIDNPNNFPIINHIDGDRTNNCVSNLEWCTHEYNTQHAIDTGLMKHRSLSEETVHTILSMMEEGYRNCDIRDITGISYDVIGKIRVGENYRSLWEQYVIPAKKETVSLAKVLEIKRMLSEGILVEQIVKALKISRSLVKDIRDLKRFTHI